MSDQIPKFAKELLSLEEKRADGELSSKENDRWEELAKNIFGSYERADTRRSCRLPTGNIKATIILGGKEHSVEISAVSLVGLTLAGKAFQGLETGAPVVLHSVEIKGEFLPVQLYLKIAATRKIGEQTNAGLEIIDANSPEMRSTYLDLIYYPAYFEYLKFLSAKVA